MIGEIAPEVALYGCAWLLCLVVKSADITTLVKAKSQRTLGEQKRVARGLLRSILLEFLVFVPASATIVLLLAPVLVPKRAMLSSIPRVSVYAALGLSSYGFPFAGIRHLIRRMALVTLQEFATISQGIPKEEHGK